MSRFKYAEECRYCIFAGKPILINLRTGKVSGYVCENKKVFSVVADDYTCKYFSGIDYKEVKGINWGK